MLSGVSVVCFFTSYLVALALEVSRLFFRMPVRLVVMLAFAVLGIVMQSAYLWHRSGESALPLSSWHDFFVIAAWILAVVYISLTIARPQTNIGLFVLPLVLILTGIAWVFPRDAIFARDRALQMWGMAHGIMLLLGTVAVSFGFIAGLMYLVQSWRLKKHMRPQSGLKLPSLEWLQLVNKQSLIWSSCFIALGLVAGIVLNTIKFQGQGTAVPWTDGVILGSAGLLVWLLAATIFEWTYKPAQQGHKVAYLTVASFVFLALVMLILLASGSQHAPAAAAGVQGGGVRGQRTEDRGQGTNHSPLTTHHSPAAPIRNPQSAIRNRPAPLPEDQA
jgi:hypothetical protein